jgi:hypothetical protein
VNTYSWLQFKMILYGIKKSGTRRSARDSRGYKGGGASAGDHNVFLFRQSPFHNWKRTTLFVRVSMLTESAAVEIYKIKIALQQQRQSDAPVSIWGKTRSVAKMFGVNSRTIKYVWNRLTWSHATEHLWAIESEIKTSSKSRQNEVVIRFLFDRHIYFADDR